MHIILGGLQQGSTLKNTCVRYGIPKSVCPFQQLNFLQYNDADDDVLSVCGRSMRSVFEITMQVSIFLLAKMVTMKKCNITIPWSSNEPIQLVFRETNFV